MERQITAYVVHDIPGRIRMRLDKSHRSPEVMRSLVQSFSRVEGVHDVRGNPSTGSLLLIYDPESLRMESLYMAAQSARLNIAMPHPQFQPPRQAGVTPAAASVNSIFGRVDAAITGLTGGLIDAKTLAPLGLTAVAVHQIITSRGHLARAPWYTLLWYAFGIFTRYNLRRNSKQPEGFKQPPSPPSSM